MYFLGIDTSTTSSKALLIDERGDVIAVASSSHTLQTPRPLWSEQNPREWWTAVSASIKSVLEKAGIGGERIAAVGLTGQMHGLVLLDEAGNVLRPAILWNDQRTQSQCDEIHQRMGKDKFIQITGNVALTGFTAPKILWVKENELDVFTKVKHVLLPKDYIRYKLTGEYAMDKADGSGTVLFDLKSRDWSREVLDALGIDPSWMPRTYEGPEFTGRVTDEAASITGLKPDTPVAAGGGDQSAQAVGVGAVGDILLRFFDENGKPVKGPLSNRVVSMSLEQLARVNRAIAVAGGARKYKAILGALRGKWINVLVTDRCTAERLVQEM